MAGADALQDGHGQAALLVEQGDGQVLGLYLGVPALLASF